MTGRSVNQLSFGMPLKREERIEELRETSIAKILDAALELFSSHGYEYTSMSQVARHAGISKGLIYNYFDSKEALLKAMIQSLQQQENKFLELFEHEDPNFGLEEMFKLFFQEIRQNTRIWKMITALSLQLDKFDFVHDIALKKLEGYYVLFQEQLEKIGYPNPEKETKLLAAIFDGIGLHYFIIREDYPLDEIEEYLIQKYCRYAT